MMTDVDVIEDVEPCHSYLLAAKYAFLKHNIKTDSLVSLSAPSDQYDLWCMKTAIARKDTFVSEVFTVSGDEDNTQEHTVDEEDSGVTADKTYTCVWCRESFSKHHDLKRHEFFHTVHNPRKCSMCHKPFKNLGDLKKHVNLIYYP